jgi:hypothetical protein
VTLLVRRIPSVIWPAGCAISAYIGARYDHSVAAAGWAALALLAMIYALGYAVLIRHEYTAVQRDIETERAALSMGRRAGWVMLTVTDLDGTMYVRTLAQILADTTPEGRDMVWDHPHSAVLWHLDDTRG